MIKTTNANLFNQQQQQQCVIPQSIYVEKIDETSPFSRGESTSQKMRYKGNRTEKTERNHENFTF